MLFATRELDRRRENKVSAERQKVQQEQIIAQESVASLTKSSIVAFVKGAHDTIDVMDPLIRLVATVLVPLFFFGMAGAAVVVIVSLIGDLTEFYGEEEE